MASPQRCPLDDKMKPRLSRAYGFVDLVRRPTARADDLTPQEISVSVPDLIRRIGITGELVPVICTFKIVFQAVRGQLEVKGHRAFKMPPPFAQREIVEAEMKKLMSALQE